MHVYIQVYMYTCMATIIGIKVLYLITEMETYISCTRFHRVGAEQDNALFLNTACNSCCCCFCFLYLMRSNWVHSHFAQFGPHYTTAKTQVHAKFILTHICMLAYISVRVCAIVCECVLECAPSKSSTRSSHH